MNTEHSAVRPPIAKFSLSDLISMAGDTEREAHDFIVTHSDASQLDAFRFPCRIDAFIIGLGTDGETEISINLNQYKLRKNTLFMIGPQSIIRTDCGGTLKGEIVIVSPQFMQRINIDSKQLMPLMLQLGAHPCIGISDNDSRQLLEFIRLMENETEDPGQFSEQTLGSLFVAQLYKIGSVIQHYIAADHAAESDKSRADIYFRQFLQTLSQHYKTERTVAFYAQQLCVTPKYLTTLIKRISGKAVSEWIEIYVILEAKTLLKYSSLSIQEIAYALNFPNQSFFGSYFKRNTGMSPSQYKAMDIVSEGGGSSLDVSDDMKVRTDSPRRS